MSTDLRRPGTDPAVHDRGDRTPVGFIQHAMFSSCPAVHVEAVALHPWIPDIDRTLRVGDKVLVGEGQGDWGEEPENFVRLTVGPRDGKGWAIAHVDLTKETARQLIRDLQEQVRKL